MKKNKLFVTIFIACFLVLNASAVFSYTVGFGLDNTFDFSIIDGLDVAVSGVNPLTDLTLDIAYTFAGGAVPGVDVPGFGIASNWDGFLTNYGANVSTGEFIPLDAADQLTSGIAFTLTADSVFDVERFDINSSIGGSGLYPVAVTVNADPTADGQNFVATTVPLPPAILLLGGGLVGLVGLRRRKISL